MSVTFKLWRYVWLTPVLGAFGLGVLWLLGLISFFIMVLALSPQQITAKTDGIVVLTGGADRVRTGMELLQHRMAHELLISGVHRTADLKDMIIVAHLENGGVPCCITLGFEAVDTVGNARETAAWVKEKNITSLRLVTANYHMARALIEMKRATPDVDLIAHPVKPDGWSPWSGRGLKLMLSEYHKTLYALVRYAKQVLT
jgi:uncharacterized SAM-binding protein YcdF (DUF218 family)